MSRLMIQFVLSVSLCPLALAQSEQLTLPSTRPQPAAQSNVDTPQLSSAGERAQAIKNARTLRIHSETIFLTVSTLERALMKQKSWNQLGLNIVGEQTSADLQLDVDRLHFTHIHTYTLTDKSTGIVLAAGRVRALDGVMASDPMAEQIAKILLAARSPAQPTTKTPGSDHGF